jgi:hypothetical protein
MLLLLLSAAQYIVMGDVNGMYYFNSPKKTPIAQRQSKTFCLCMRVILLPPPLISGVVFFSFLIITSTSSWVVQPPPPP